MLQTELFSWSQQLAGGARSFGELDVTRGPSCFCFLSEDKAGVCLSLGFGPQQGGTSVLQPNGTVLLTDPHSFLTRQYSSSRFTELRRRRLRPREPKGFAQRQSREAAELRFMPSTQVLSASHSVWGTASLLPLPSPFPQPAVPAHTTLCCAAAYCSFSRTRGRSASGRTCLSGSPLTQDLAHRRCQ